MPKILIIDDHLTVLNVTIAVLQQHFPEAKIDKAEDAQTAENQVETFQPNVVVMDLSIPQTGCGEAKIDTGLQLLRNLMQKYPTLNLVVQSTHIGALIRIKPSIDAHTGGFSVADKSLYLAFNEGLQDREIAQHMHISERMVRHYWSRIQDALNVYPEDGTNIRIRTQMRARVLG